MNFQRLAKKQTGLGPPSPTASGTGDFGGGSKAIYGLTGVLATTELVRGATVSGTGIVAGTRIEEILNDSTIIIDTATTAPGLGVALTFDEIFPYGSVATDGTSIFLSGKDHRPIDIGIPIGVILAWHPRLFSAAGNSGVDTADRTTLPDNYRLCDGSDITSTGSPLINGASVRLPDLTDNRFLMGSTILGDVGGTNDSSHTHTYKHYHPLSFSGTTTSNGSHRHSYTNWPNEGGNTFESEPGPSASRNETETPQNTGFAGLHNHTFSDTTITEGLGNTMDDSSNPPTSNSSATENRPVYLSIKYIMRVK